MTRRLRSAALLLFVVACAGDSAGDDETTQVSASLTSTATTDAGTTSASATGSTTAGESTSDASTSAATSTTASTTAASTTTASTSTTGTTAADTGMLDTGDPSSSSSGDTGDGLDPPAGQSSGGSGGGAANGEVRVTSMGGVTYRVIAPGLAGPRAAMIVYSGVEGGAVMTQNLLQTKEFVGLGDVVFGVIDGADYYGDGQAGVFVLDALRDDYDVDNDRTYLLSESAGTSAGLKLGLDLRQSYFAAYWANDVNASASPTLSAAALGFAPFGNAGPGGAFAQANAIVNGMQGQGYQTPPPAPYDGPGADVHGDTQQFLAALQWFPGKSRQ